jgi:hypothetical protein
METRLEENIYQTPHGFRVYHREPDPVTGRSKKVARRFSPATPIDLLRAYRDTSADPVRRLAFRLSAVDQDTDAAGWARYVPIAQWLVETFEMTERHPGKRLHF